VLLNLKPILAFALALTVGSAPAGERIVWKPLENAVLKVDERPAKVWNVYRAEKKDHLLLVTLGRRFLMLDIKGREIYELDPTKFAQKNNELLWHEADKPARPLPTADWVVRDAGRARRIRVRLADEGRVLEVQVPITQDFRSVY
jgi:hypothetical protein